MLPAAEDLKTARLAAAKIDDRLEVGNQRACGDRGAQLRLQLHARSGIHVHGGVVGHRGAGRTLLGIEKRKVGLANELLVGRGIAWVDSAAHTRTDLEIEPVEAHGLQQRVDDLAAHAANGFVVALERQYDEKLIATVAGLHLGVGQRCGQAVGDLLQNEIAHEMTVLIVDRFEAVEVDHEHGELGMLAFGVRKCLFQLDEQGAAVGEAGEGVVHGEAADRAFGANEGRLRASEAYVEPVPEGIGAQPAEHDNQRQRELGSVLQAQKLAADLDKRAFEEPGRAVGQHLLVMPVKTAVEQPARSPRVAFAQGLEGGTSQREQPVVRGARFVVELLRGTCGRQFASPPDGTFDHGYVCLVQGTPALLARRRRHVGGHRQAPVSEKNF